MQLKRTRVRQEVVQTLISIDMHVAIQIGSELFSFTPRGKVLVPAADTRAAWTSRIRPCPYLDTHTKHRAVFAHVPICAFSTTELVVACITNGFKGQQQQKAKNGQQTKQQQPHKSQEQGTRTGTAT
eukprot:6016321-Amphidinium_carterae.1